MILVVDLLIWVYAWLLRRDPRIMISYGRVIHEA